MKFRFFSLWCTLGLADSFTSYIPLQRYHPQLSVTARSHHSQNIIFCKENGKPKILTYFRPRIQSGVLTTTFMVKDDNESDTSNMNSTDSSQYIKQKNLAKKLSIFIDDMFEIPDGKLLMGDILFLLIVNFLLQIADQIADPSFWLHGGFGQQMTIPTSMLAFIVRDSKMTISWIVGAIWNRAYSSSSVENDEVALKVSLKIWVDYFSIRVLIELAWSMFLTHVVIESWPLLNEVWYTAIVMVFFRIAYGRFHTTYF